MSKKSVNEPTCDWEMGPPPTTPIKTQLDQGLSGIIGKHIIYTYANGWHYEYYFRNENVIACPASELPEGYLDRQNSCPEFPAQADVEVKVIT